MGCSFNHSLATLVAIVAGLNVFGPVSEAASQEPVRRGDLVAKINSLAAATLVDGRVDFCFLEKLSDRNKSR